MALHLPPEATASGTDTHSTSEVQTNKVWIDGRPIFRKVLALGNLPNANFKDVPHGITGVTRWLPFRGHAYSADGTTIGLPHVDTASLAGQAGLFVDNTKVRVITGNDRTAYTGYVVLEYTK